MEKIEYRKMSDHEGTLWWYRALHLWVLAKLKRVGTDGQIVFDAGCGTGGLATNIESFMPEINYLGMDVATEALKLAYTKTNHSLVLGSIDNLPFLSGSMDAIVSLDVLYHAAADEKLALSEFRRCLKPGGTLLLHLPAFDWLRSYHDEAVHSARRYTARELRRKLSDAGFSHIEVGYRLGITLPLLILKRLFSRQTGSDVEGINPLLNEFLFCFARIESWFSRHSLSLPFGSSVWAQARK